MAKPNYNHAKRQREAARKVRQEARLARRQQSKLEPDAPGAADATEATPVEVPAADPKK